MFSPTDSCTQKSSHWCRVPSREAADPTSVVFGVSQLGSNSEPLTLRVAPSLKSHWLLEYFGFKFGFKVHILLVFRLSCCRLCRCNFTGVKNTVRCANTCWLLAILFFTVKYFWLVKPLPCAGLRQLSALDWAELYSRAITVKHQKEMSILKMFQYIYYVL